jgi:cytochrome c nitrite reductase small subunit
MAMSCSAEKHKGHLVHIRPFWRAIIFITLAVALGLAVIDARISNFASYLSDAPETCINCHVMNDAYATWQRGSHAHVAICNDCHVPHSNVAAKYAFKARDGFKHSYVFTLRQESQVLRLSRPALGVVQSNCIRCHTHQLQMVRLAGVSERKCWDCHDNIHGPVRSLSASPHVRHPQLPYAGLFWMRQGVHP